MRRGGEVALGDEAVRAVEVGAEGFEQVGALDEAAGDAGGLLLLDQDGDVGERPGALARALRAVLAEEDAGVAQVLLAAGEAAGELVRGQAGDVVDEGAPDRPSRPSGSRSSSATPAAGDRRRGAARPGRRRR